MPQKNTNREKALGLMKKRSSDAYDQAKDAEARAGGRVLPGGLENEVAVIHSSQLDVDKNNNPMLILKGTVLTPEEYHGVFISFAYFFNDSDFSTYDDTVKQFVNDMKLLGWNTGQHADEISLMDAVDKKYNKEKVVITYNTTKRPKNDGTYRAFPSGLSHMEIPSDGKAPSRAPRKSPQQASSPFSVGDKVETSGDYFNDGNTYSGIVKSTNGDGIVVIFDDDNSEQEIPSGSLLKVSGDGDADTTGFEVDDAVVTVGDYFGSGEEYSGVVTEVGDDTCTVEFEDGAYDVPFANLQAAQ